MGERLYILDYEIIGAISVWANNPQAAAASARALIQAVARRLEREGDCDLTISPRAIDVAARAQEPT